MLDLVEKEFKSQESGELVLTENGANVFATSDNDILDMNFRIPSYRTSEASARTDYMEAFIGNEEFAVKWLFYVRDVRGGLGERKFFRECIVALSDSYPSKVIPLIPQIAEYGRFDDVLYLIENTAKSEVRKAGYDFLSVVLKNDVALMKEKKPISLLAKWLPSINTSSRLTRVRAKSFMENVGISSAKSYRKTLSSLRKYLEVVEVQMSAGNWKEINYSRVPSRANLLYKDAFLKHDSERREKFLEKVESGEEKINSSVLYPSDIVAKYFDTGWISSLKKQDASLEALWKAMPKFELDNTIVVADGSGSMIRPQIGGVTPLEVANALAIYCSEVNKGVFADKYITFSSKPKMVSFKREMSLRQKLEIALKHNEVQNTNIEAVFELILDTAVKNHLKQEELVKNILIVSDMEFDRGTENSDKALFEAFKEKYKEFGYELPRIVFWNVGAKMTGIPLKNNDRGVALVSGYSTSIIKMVMSNELNPLKALKAMVYSERYESIKW